MFDCQPIGWCEQVMHCSGTLVKECLNPGHLSNEGSIYCTSCIEMCTNLPLNSNHLSNEDSAYCPSGLEMRSKLPLK